MQNNTKDEELDIFHEFVSTPTENADSRASRNWKITELGNTIQLYVKKSG
jgi:hypothetical protein